ncbi:MAG: 2-amino-4-hydroxy-6-hydroxymethyldihydropteridine diphosphokinase [Verrucomicrobiota bacterium]
MSSVWAINPDPFMATLPNPHEAVGIALGSNLGDRHAEIRAGFAFLDSLDINAHARRSGVIETLPVDCQPGDPVFLNAVAEIHFSGEPRELLRRLQAFERERGRLPSGERPVNAPRSLDLDILYFGQRRIDETDLTVPHPRTTQRRFVLEPLAQIRPDLILPGQNKSVAELLADCP